MNRRPLAAQKQRPLSAIFIGSYPSTSTSSPPELPPPPSPSASSNGSGLPSPPATNSTGSGSVGDDSTNGGSVRRKAAPRSQSVTEMLNGTYDKFKSNGRGRIIYTDDEDDPNENDEDNTARLSLDRKRPPLKVPPDPTDNMSALQRVKSLTHRNRLVLDKLTSISRMSSPAPSKARSHVSPSNTTSPSESSSTGSSRVSSSSHKRFSQSTSNIHDSSSSPQYADHPRSGSETEREPPHAYSHSYSSSDSLSATPTSSYSELRPTGEFVRPRQLSAPSSPAKGRNSRNLDRDKDAESDRRNSPGPSRTPRKRASMAMSVQDRRYDFAEDEGQHDITAAALAAVASSRRSPTDTRRSRQPLPPEFRERDRRSLDGKSEPGTPQRNRERERERSRRSPSPRSPRASTSNFPSSSVQTSPRRPGASRFSTVRELTRKHQTRWLSEDLSASVDGDDDNENRSANYGRRQGHKAGSSDSPLALGSGRTLLGEGLRAAGLTKRKEGGDDVFASTSGNDPGQSIVPRRTRSTGPNSIAHGDWDSPGAPSSRVGEGVGPPSNQRILDPRTPANGSQRQTDRSVTYSGSIRPGTSMAAFHSDMPPPRTAPAGLRTYRSPYILDRDPSSSYQVVDDRSAPNSSVQDRTYSSPFATMRSTTAPLPASAMSGNGRDAHAEHRRLMLEALTMFESHLSRLPPMGQTTTTTIPEVFQNAQHLVHTMDKLNTMLKSSTNKALEAQIDAEVADEPGTNISELFAQIGLEHRDNLRLSDEVVRTMTAFMLGVGKVLRDATSSREQQHLRTMSLDEEATRKTTPDINTLSVDRRSSDGRRSRETRRSWDPRETGHTLLAPRMMSRERTTTSRPASSLNLLRSSGTSSSEGQSTAENAVEQTPQTVRNITSTLLGSGSVARRTYISREQRVTPEVTPLYNKSVVSLNSPDTMHNYEPSPTPASRLSSEQTRTLPPLSIPPSLPTLPSESLLRRRAVTPASADKSTRRKISSSSNITVRTETSASFAPVIKPPHATTAVTAVSVSNSPETGTSVLPRDDPPSGARSNGVTFSRPSTISISTLSGLQHHDTQYGRERTISISSAAEEPSPVSAVSSTLRSPMSGSETERPRTLGLRGRVSLDRAILNNTGGNDSRASTLLPSRKERRRTITEIFSQR